jgi:hypothetical protein
MAARRWTAEQKEQQSRKIHDWKPWEKSTGPITPEGKSVSSKNAQYEACQSFNELRMLKEELDSAGKSYKLKYEKAFPRIKIMYMRKR